MLLSVFSSHLISYLVHIMRVLTIVKKCRLFFINIFQLHIFSLHMFLLWVVCGIRWNIQCRRYSTGWQTGAANTQPLGAASLCVCLSVSMFYWNPSQYRTCSRSRITNSTFYHTNTYTHPPYNIKIYRMIELLTRQCKCRNVIDDLYYFNYFFSCVAHVYNSFLTFSTSFFLYYTFSNRRKI